LIEEIEGHQQYSQYSYGISNFLSILLKIYPGPTVLLKDGLMASHPLLMHLIRLDGHIYSFIKK